jgi:hypothetical protein
MRSNSSDWIAIAIVLAAILSTSAVIASVG